jgi:hypothetical protein
LKLRDAQGRVILTGPLRPARHDRRAKGVAREAAICSAFAVGALTAIHARMTDRKCILHGPFARK